MPEMCCSKALANIDINTLPQRKFLPVENRKIQNRKQLEAGWVPYKGIKKTICPFERQEEQHQLSLHWSPSQDLPQEAVETERSQVIPALFNC